ncbi:hypothetical protein ACFQPA_13100 [Halomarina halobia]|uniref:Peptidase M10A and M12B matrixin and adamalysin n=1 Tax=Halomarina halobia TaxID=3033386 RepID=A0ABD6A8N0_9EURY|nr:hypothetical protein [Halomarina sp. PSR21]
MKRRKFLLSAGAIGSMGFTGRWISRPEDTLNVKVWFSERAAAYPGLRRRVGDYLGRAFRRAHDGTVLEFGGTLRVSTERAYDLVVGGEWPRRLAQGSAGLGPATPCDDVNLLVTDEPLTEWPTGAGVPHVAAVGGAAAMASLPPAAIASTVVGRTWGTYAMQVALHECGHALGLDHDVGSMRPDDGALVVSPMVSGYPWETQSIKAEYFDYERSVCGCRYVEPDGREPRLMLRYSDCAAERIRTYRGGVTPW